MLMLLAAEVVSAITRAAIVDPPAEPTSDTTVTAK